jgi:hypothetical protein
MDCFKKGRDIVKSHLSGSFEISISKHWDSTASLRGKDNFKPICLQNLYGCLPDIRFVCIDITTIEIGNLAVSSRWVFLKPLPKGGRFVKRQGSPSIYSENGFYYPFDCRGPEEPVRKRGKQGSQPTIEIGMSEKPVSERPSLFIQVFCLGDEIQFGDIYPGGADHIAEVTPNTEINPFINGRLPRRSESLSTWACLLWSWKERGDPRDRADRHTGSATNTNICVTLRPMHFFRLLHNQVLN